MSFEQLKELLPSWPKAVPDFLICDEQSKEQKDLRAEEIVEFLLPSLDGLRVLDFGCGEGHMAMAMGKIAASAVGYDIKAPEEKDYAWEEENGNAFLTTDADQLGEPFDIVFVHDVLDHIEGPVPPVIEQILDLCRPEGKVYFRCHPWAGRHGGHLYQQVNKAFIHVVFTDEELESMGYTVPHVRKVKYPMSTYKNWLGKAGIKKGFSIFSQDKKKPEGFFRKAIILERLKSVFEKDKFPGPQMGQSFVDFSIKKN
jgi:2-polyprenyl-3-methyl-5-hydroxy-6-metoxy-1,4-benzoquinol methylase